MATGVMPGTNSPYKFGSATTEQFRDVVEAGDGEELDYFSRSGLRQVHNPSTPTSHIRKGRGRQYNLYLVIRQDQVTNPQVFSMPIDVFRNLRAWLMTRW